MWPWPGHLKPLPQSIVDIRPLILVVIAWRPAPPRVESRILFPGSPPPCWSPPASSMRSRCRNAGPARPGCRRTRRRRRNPRSGRKRAPANLVAAARRRRRCKSRGAAGRIFWSAPTMRSRTTACWRLPRVSFSIPWSHCFRESQPGFPSYALFADAGTIARHLSIAADIVPAGGLDLLGQEITRIAAKSDGRLTFGFVAGLLLALWSANAGMKAIFDALNVIYDEERKAELHSAQPGVAVFHGLCACGGRGGDHAGGGISAAAGRIRPLQLGLSGRWISCAGRCCSC